MDKNEKREIVKPDLGLFSLAHFLDRFVYKKAKSKANLKGSSIMQPLGGAHTGDLLVRATGVDTNEIPANTEDWLNKKAKDIKPEDRFFYQYFVSKQEKLARSNLDKEFEKKAKGDDDEDDASDLDEDTVWDALVKSNPEIEQDSDDDDDMSDFDMSELSDNEDEEEAAAALDVLEDDVSDDEDEEGLVRLKTIEDLDSGSEEEEDQEEDIIEDNANDIDSSDGEDLQELLAAESDEIDSEEEVEVEEEKSSKKRSKSQEKRSKRAKLKALPTFADADDYSKYLDADD